MKTSSTVHSLLPRIAPGTRVAPGTPPLIVSEVDMPIQPHSNETQTKWDHGEFQVMIKSPKSDRPIGFCDGEPADEREIREQAEREGAEIEIDKKRLKTGREIWTVRTVSSL